MHLCLWDNPCQALRERMNVFPGRSSHAPEISWFSFCSLPQMLWLKPEWRSTGTATQTEFQVRKWRSLQEMTGWSKQNQAKNMKFTLSQWKHQWGRRTGLSFAQDIVCALSVAIACKFGELQKASNFLLSHKIDQGETWTDTLSLSKKREKLDMFLKIFGSLLTSLFIPWPCSADLFSIIYISFLPVWLKGVMHGNITVLNKTTVEQQFLSLLFFSFGVFCCLFWSQHKSEEIPTRLLDAIKCFVHLRR